LKKNRIVVVVVVIVPLSLFYSGILQAGPCVKFIDFIKCVHNPFDVLIFCGLFAILGFLGEFYVALDSRE
jgi:hypothetical protein